MLPFKMQKHTDEQVNVEVLLGHIAVPVVMIRTVSVVIVEVYVVVIQWWSERLACLLSLCRRCAWLHRTTRPAVSTAV